MFVFWRARSVLVRFIKVTSRHSFHLKSYGLRLEIKGLSPVLNKCPPDTCLPCFAKPSSSSPIHQIKKDIRQDVLFYLVGEEGLEAGARHLTYRCQSSSFGYCIQHQPTTCRHSIQTLLPRDLRIASKSSTIITSVSKPANLIGFAQWVRNCEEASFIYSLKRRYQFYKSSFRRTVPLSVHM